MHMMRPTTWTSKNASLAKKPEEMAGTASARDETLDDDMWMYLHRMPATRKRDYDSANGLANNFEKYGKLFF